jgi:hypothetical protein
MSRLPVSRLALIGLLALCVLFAWCGMALAQTNPLLGLGDPTRPPPGLAKAERLGATGTTGATGVAAPEAASAASAPPAPREPELVLQLVRIDPVGGKGVALINDQLLEPGGRIEGWTLLGLTSNEAVLQGPRGRLRLSLTGAQVIERNPKSAQSRRGRKE